ncbi:phage N-6-adenine-methyltransferase [Cronobacter sakazakii]|uniref:phage N-6-adenine-methyltransferase n=2 Tax=Cronobacter sakazakii TaxID=28141 RepID=UPI000DA1CC86|nr:phage N-6-adenine-methyltransferase [Cronobacter sakazakii]ELY6330424.1 phage N-6-adenine-methyltransferase [Cronobacter malonaticus]EKM1390378.1 phage N-6-adenine-methyltransferase [Cronobacter sakazakii]EKM6441244.1 phage N-6-adenine-methyltransferase [Cronobacter sakazakii]ELY6420418.1 phage N-6-adenine-methyltransferase [Cronobacter malonaticus]KAB0845088.1 phage N-6-adenine-methyltransferase [Cronobacter sakazakii]
MHPLNAYSQALAALRSKPAHELKEVGDQWRTPDNIFWGINAMFGPLVLDLFSDGENAKCEAYYTAEDNALTQDWSARLAELNGAAFGNPPYSRASRHDGDYITGMRYIMQHASAMRDKGGRYVFLIKAATSEVWWPEDADHISFIRGRIGFDLPKWFIPKDEKQVPSGAFFAGAIAVFDKNWRGPAISYIDRKDLEARGDAFIAQIRREALRLLPQMQQQNISEVIPGAGDEVVESAAAQDQVDEVALPAPAKGSEDILPLSQADILAQSGIHAWACVRAVFGDKEEYTFKESKFAHVWASDNVSEPTVVMVSAGDIAVAEVLIAEKSVQLAVSEWLDLNYAENDPAKADMQERLHIAGMEAMNEYGMAIPTFMDVIKEMDPAARCNIRNIRVALKDFSSKASLKEDAA